MTPKSPAQKSDLVWSEFSERIRSFVSRRLGQPADVEDTVQEIFVRIHSNLPSLKETQRLQAWIFAIARNVIADRFRRASRSPRPLPEELDLETSSAREPTETALQEELSQCLQPMIAALPRLYREAIELTELDGLSQVAAAGHLGISVSGMKTRVQRARRKLKQTLLKCCEFEADHSGRIVTFSPRPMQCTCCSASATAAQAERLPVHRARQRE